MVLVTVVLSAVCSEDSEKVKVKAYYIQILLHTLLIYIYSDLHIYSINASLQAPRKQKKRTDSKTTDKVTELSTNDDEVHFRAERHS